MVTTLSTSLSWFNYVATSTSAESLSMIYHVVDDHYPEIYILRLTEKDDEHKDE